MDIGNLLQDIPSTMPDELTATLLRHGAFRLERIVSRGHRSAPGFWYDQAEHEWVLLIKGEAMLRFEQGERKVHLTEGMHVHITAHEKHRVEWTREDTETIWLALFYGEPCSVGENSFHQ